MKNWLISILLGVITLLFNSYLEYQIEQAYKSIGELRMIVDFGYSAINETILIILMVLSLIFSLLSILWKKEKLGFVGLSLFVLNTFLYLF